MAIHLLPKIALRRVGWAMVLAIGFTGFGSASVQAACEDASSNVEIGACLEREFEQADKELNRIWKEVHKSIDASDHVPADQRKIWKQVLLDGQRGWLQLRDNDCLKTVPYEWYGGSGAGIAAMSCQLDMTKARTADLKKRYGLD